jgi:phage-related protein
MAPATGKQFLAKVYYDPDCLADFNEEVSSKEERKAVYNAVDKLRRLGEQLRPPHMKPLKGEKELRELRPRQGRSPTRPLYRRFGESSYVILAIAVKSDFAKKTEIAQDRARQYE